MRLLLVNAHGDDVSVGGVESNVSLLSEELSRRGFEVSLLRAFPGDGRIAEQTVLHGTDWRTDATRRIANHLGDVVSRPHDAFCSAIRRHRPDIVHTHNLPGIGTGIWEACRRAGVPVVHTVSDYHLLCPRVTLMRRDATPCRPNPLLCGVRRRRLERWAHAVAHVIGCSQHVLDVHSGMFRHAEQHVIRNPLPSVVIDVPAPESPPRALGYIGALDRIKGVHVLLEAVPELARYGCDVHLAGQGRLQADVVSAAEQQSVHFHGLVTGQGKRAFLERCDIGVIPSVWQEPGGPTLGMVEWLVAGRPVLVSRRGGLAEVVDSFPGAIAIDPTADAIVRQVRRLLEPERWREIVESVRPIEGGDDRRRWVDAHEAIYRLLA